MNTKGEKIQLLSVLCLFLFITSCAKSPEKMLIGEWKGADQTTEENFYLVFNEDGSARMIFENTVLDDASGGGVETVTWAFDASHDPMHLDIVMSVVASEEIIILPMIVRFVGDNKLQVRFGEDFVSRPIEFSLADESNQVLFERQ